MFDHTMVIHFENSNLNYLIAYYQKLLTLK